MVFAAQKMTNKKGMDETSLCGDVRVWPIWESINRDINHVVTVTGLLLRRDIWEMQLFVPAWEQIGCCNV